MTVKFRTYKNDNLYGNDYTKIRNFLLELDSHNYTFGRWDWMVMSVWADWTDPEGIERIGIWQEDEKIVGLATYDNTLGSAYLLTLKGYEKLKREMFDYSKGNLAKDEKYRVLILDGDMELQNIAVNNCFYPTQEKECDAIYPISLETIEYKLPNGFKIVSFNENFDIYKYGQVCWKGFNHEMNGEGPFYLYWEKHSERYKQAWKRPNIDLNLKIFVEAPNGDFVSHCGMWYDKVTETALVEPVATEPAYRKMGLGRAAVLEGIKRCGKLGAKRAYVSSSQQFYYNIGFRPYATSTWWEEKEK
jgi:GNAT superfamily N-acetyltransferase